ncbi:MAG: ligase-associated DNA damage response exonuclease [Oscillochloris sp.]|nr:ligase-associated DNA damage response exonuclease [Oscillochloris sp.]
MSVITAPACTNALTTDNNAVSLLALTAQGLYCSQADLYIDPWAAVDRAIITHAHSDHARPGSKAYLCSTVCAPLLRMRLGEIQIETLAYGEALIHRGVKISLHPAGHILGAAQVRLEYQGEVWVVSGDYKTEPDPTCAFFEPIRCHGFVSEATFGLPIYHWPAQTEVFAQINQWWRANQAAGRASLLLGYALGKAQRLLAGLDPDIGPIVCHGAVEQMNQLYRAAGVALPATRYSGDLGRDFAWSQALIVAPPSAHGTTWSRRFGEVSAGMASGWMQIRGTRRRRSVDRGFVLSDHADWSGLLGAIAATGAEKIWVTHGYTAALARYLAELGYDTSIVPTRFEGEHTSDDIGEA